MAKPKVQTARHNKQVRLICPTCGRRHSATTPTALLRWWRAHRLSEEDT